MTTQKPEQLLVECEKQQQENNAAQLAQVTAQWSEAARTGADCEELEQLIERCNLVSKRLVLRREALEQQQQADIEQARVADVERVTDECNAIAAGIAQQYKAISGPVRQTCWHVRQGACRRPSDPQQSARA